MKNLGRYYILPPLQIVMYCTGPIVAFISASSGAGETQYPVDVKQYFEELCPVCGDKVSGYHYGLLTCESCKGT